MFESLCGISRITSTLLVYELSVDIPTIHGVACFAACHTLPPKTVLLGIDFSHEKFVQLVNFIKQNPLTVNIVTRAMCAEDALSEHVSEAFHASEGCCPIPFEDIFESVTVADDTISDVLATEHSPNVSSTGSQNSLTPVSLPSLSFDGVNKDQFKNLQYQDPSLAPLWELLAHNHKKKFFIVDELLMCLTTTHNTVSNALVVPQELRHKVLIAAQDGLGHGGVSATRSLINKHFTWPKILDDVINHILVCTKCQKFTKSNNIKVPLVEAEIISERGEKIAIDIVGPLPKAKSNFRFIFTCLELASGYPFAIPIRNFTSESTLSSTSHICRKFGIHKMQTSPYHPQSNGRLERFHATLKCMLSKALVERSD